MQKRHFIALADHLRLPGQLPARIDRVLEYYGHQNEDGLKTQLLNEIALELCHFCKSQNGQFNQERWLGYIRGENGPSGGSRESSRSK